MIRVCVSAAPVDSDNLQRRAVETARESGASREHSIAPSTDDDEDAMDEVNKERMSLTN